MPATATSIAQLLTQATTAPAAGTREATGGFTDLLESETAPAAKVPARKKEKLTDQAVPVLAVPLPVDALRKLGAAEAPRAGEEKSVPVTESRRRETQPEKQDMLAAREAKATRDEALRQEAKPRTADEAPQAKPAEAPRAAQKPVDAPPEPTADKAPSEAAEATDDTAQAALAENTDAVAAPQSLAGLLQALADALGKAMAAENPQAMLAAMQQFTQQLAALGGQVLPAGQAQQNITAEGSALAFTSTTTLIQFTSLSLTTQAESAPLDAQLRAWIEALQRQLAALAGQPQAAQPGQGDAVRKLAALFAEPMQQG